MIRSPLQGVTGKSTVGIYRVYLKNAAPARIINVRAAFFIFRHFLYAAKAYFPTLLVCGERLSFLTAGFIL